MPYQLSPLKYKCKYISWVNWLSCLEYNRMLLGVCVPRVVVTVDVLWNQCVLRHCVVILQAAFVRKVVRGDGKRGRHSQGLPVHA